MSHSSHLRNREFIRRCITYARNEALAGRAPMAREVVGHVLAGSAPLYYVDYYRARAILTRALAEDTCPRGSYTGPAAQWADMYRDLKEILARHPQKSIDDLIWQLCAGHAGKPRFYITPRRAMQILRRHFNENP